MTNQQVQQWLQRETGLALSLAAVEGAVHKRMKQRRIDDRSAYSTELARSEGELGALIDLVVVPETWFFRDAESFTVAARMAAAIRDKGQIARILSAPCASGEEPYSIAMALFETGLKPGEFLIDAVDVSPDAIRRAQRGIYPRNAFRGNDLGFRERYFSPRGEGFELRADIRKPVRFRCANLFSLSPLDGMPYDIIFCRNLLIYFDDVTQAAAVRKLQTQLDDHGLLFCGYAETLAFCTHGFARAPYANAFALQKNAVVRHTPSPTIPAAPRRKDMTAIAAVSMPPPTQPSPAPAKQDPAALLQNANRLADQGDLDEARKTYEEYLHHVPDSAEAHFMLGLLSERREQERDAEVFLRRAVYLDPEHYEALCHLALLAERKGDEAAARAYRQRAARVYGRREGGRNR